MADDLDLAPFEEEGSFYRALPAAQPGEERAWRGYPSEDRAYEDFIRSLLDRVAPGSRVRKAVIDYTSLLEGSVVHGGQGRPGISLGWTDPELEGIGSVSREVEPVVVLQEQPCHVSLRRRELSFVALDYPTKVRSDEFPIFWQAVINTLCHLPKRSDHLYRWLDTFFAFCIGEVVGYVSRYPPGPRIERLARQYDVLLLPRHLTAIPRRTVQLHRRFRLMNLTETQWNTLNGLVAHDPSEQQRRTTR